MGLWGSESFKEQFFQLFTELSCVSVCVCWFLLAHTCVTHSPSQPAVPQHPLCALQNATFCIEIEIENKMFTDFKKPQDTMRYRLQVAKHATGAISYFNYKIHIT